MYLFSRSINLWSYGFHKFCISSVYSILDSVPSWGCLENMYLQGLMYSSYKGNNWMYNPNIPISMWRCPHVFDWYILVNPRFMDCEGWVTSADTSIPTKLHLSWNHFHFFSFSIACWCFKTPRNVLNYTRSCSAVRLYSNISPTRIFYASFFKPRYLDSVSHFIFRFFVIDKNVGAAFRDTIRINFSPSLSIRGEW